jgi:RNA-directed DNA polymerase
MAGSEIKEKFKQLHNLNDVALLLGIAKSHLIYELYIRPDRKKYISFYIPKKSGGNRTIKSPIYPLKKIQSRLNEILQEVYNPRKTVHSFIKNENILRNAKPHVSKKWVLNIDLSEFFPTINFPRVRGLFIGKPYRLNESAATVLAQICCHESTLPQGAPTSPIISNMICSKLDAELYRLVV